RAVTGVDVTDDARELLPPDLRADGFSNTAYNLNVDLAHVAAYTRLAQIIVERMDIRSFAARYESSFSLGRPSMRRLIAEMGTRIFRGPLEPHEVEPLVAIADAVADEGGTFDEAVAFTLEAMLAAPKFIYRIEDWRGDGRARDVSGPELASRMSYILWGGPPDEELLEAALRGDLSERSAIEAHARRMLDDPRAIEQSLRFVRDWLDLGRLAHLRPNAERFPGFGPELAADMREETLAFFRHVVWTEKRPLVDLMDAQVTFLTPRLAKHYGLEPKGDGIARYDVSDVPSRGGILTHGSVLTVGGDNASMVTRGLFVLHDMLAGRVDDPPPGVDTTPVPSRPGLPQRKVAEERLANPSCGGCHAKFEPFAFAFERFDGVGAYREVDEFGNALRDDGDIVLPGREEPITYKNLKELTTALARSDRFRETLTLKLTQFAIGRPLVASDSCSLEEIHDEAGKDGGTYSSYMTAIILSDLVRKTRTEKMP
ncbi:MAG TPA: DUF1592 domain-containing protein, partial [Planctomycetota bacterium]|nr:DUF1592 domain-containing protein [Planctomycetota bacterium]